MPKHPATPLDSTARPVQPGTNAELDAMLARALGKSEAEAAEAERQVAIIRIELAAAISTKRQTLGLLPQ